MSDTKLQSNDLICTRCGYRAPASRRCHCASCCRTFAGPTLFDGHRSQRGEHGACLDPADLPGFEFRDGCWRGPEATDEMRARWAASSEDPPAEEDAEEESAESVPAADPPRRRGAVPFAELDFVRSKPVAGE